MSEDQVTGLLTGIARQGHLTLTQLNMDDINISQVSPALLSRAVLRLEIVSLNGTQITEQQMIHLFTQIAGEKKVRLSELHVQKGEYNQHSDGLHFIEDTLVEKVKSKLRSWLW